MLGRVAFVAIMLVLGSGRVSFAQPADTGNGDFHCPKPTTVITFSSRAKPSGRIAAIALRSIDHGCVLKIGNKEVNFYDILVEPTGLVDPANRAKAEALWPLKVGKIVEFNDDPGLANELARTSYVSRKLTYTVVSYEPITIWAGRFDAYAIDVRAEVTVSIYTRADFVRVVRYYYAPAVGMFVKAEIKDGFEDPPLLAGLASQLQPSSLVPEIEAASISTP